MAKMSSDKKFSPKTARQFLVVHLWLVFSDAPSPRHLVGVGHLELPAVAGPADKMLAALVRQQLQQELPKLDGAAAGKAGAGRSIGIGVT